MTNYIADSSIRQVILGQGTSYSWTLPASATTQTLFTVGSGNILVTSLFGVVTTLIGSTTTTLALGTHPTTGTLETAGIATATAITSAEAGTWLGVQASSGTAGALVNGAHAGNVVFFATAPFTVAPGTITATTSANAGGGVINWYITYVTLDNGATVTHP